MNNNLLLCVESADWAHSPDLKSVHRGVGFCEHCERDIEEGLDGKWRAIARAAWPVASSVAQSDGAA